MTPSPFPLIARWLLFILQIITHNCYYNYFILLGSFYTNYYTTAL